jgi:MoxR-like ATPase
LRVRVVDSISKSLSEYVVGLRELLKLLNIALLSRGHILIEGPTGVGKTVTAKLFAQSIGGTFKRIQMVPDILPSDIIGTYYFDMEKSSWILRRGPIFSNVLLVDELNRAPPRTQAAFLEAMQEGCVTIEGNTIPLPDPFIVLATQIPYGGEGTYPLTPVQVDRFAYYYPVSYPLPEEEEEIVSRADVIDSAVIKPTVSVEDVLRAQREVMNVFVSGRVKKYIVSLVNFIRGQKEVLAGPSPRASIWLYRGSRALAYIEGMDYVLPDHVKSISKYVFLKRITLKPEYEVEGLNPMDIINRALESVEVPKA